MAKKDADTEIVAPDTRIINAFSPNTLEAVMAEYGITQSDVHVPVPATTQKSNLRELCVVTTPVVDERGNAIKGVKGHTGPLMYLAKSGEYDGDKFDAYDGFYVFTILHPVKGKIALTVGRKKDEEQPAVVRYLLGLTKGAMFQVAEIGTSSGYGVFQPVPVQRGNG